VGIRTRVGKGCPSPKGLVKLPKPAFVGVEVKLGTAVMVGVSLGVVTTVGVDGSAVGGGTVGVTNSATTSFMEQAVSVNIIARPRIVFFITAYSLNHTKTEVRESQSHKLYTHKIPFLAEVTQLKGEAHTYRIAF